MSKTNQLMLLMSIEEVREELKLAKNSIELAEIHARLIALYSCIDTAATIDALTIPVNKRGVA